MKPTDEQVAILDHMSGSEEPLMINALAGTGKSTTLNMIDFVYDAVPVLYLVFNRRNADEALEKQKAEEIPGTTRIKTFNGFGATVWNKTNGESTLSPNKVRDLTRQFIREAPKNTQGDLWDVYWDIVQGVAMAKALGYVPGKLNITGLIDRDDFHDRLDPRPDDLTADVIDEILFQSIKTAYKGSVDYNDQIYMPTLFGGSFPYFPHVKVDEYQDLNPINHAMLSKLKDSRLTGVGDTCQNIYAFRGAKAGGMAEAVSTYQMKQMELSISFRCPEEVVKAARWRVPQFKWLKTGGLVERLTDLDAGDIPDDGTFISRNNAPLFRLGLQLLAAGRSVKIHGSDIGPKVVGIMRKLGPEDTRRDNALALIEEWRAEKLAAESTTANDIADCMGVFARNGRDLGQSISWAEHLFKQSGKIQLLTGHKSKGLEFEKVYLLDTWSLGQDEQDLNLRYVMQTRSLNELYEIDSNRIKF